MKRSRESGALYRSKRKAKEEFIKKNEGALMKFVVNKKPSECVATIELSNSPSSSTIEPSNTDCDTIAKGFSSICVSLDCTPTVSKIKLRNLSK